LKALHAFLEGILVGFALDINLQLEGICATHIIFLDWNEITEMQEIMEIQEI